MQKVAVYIRVSTQEQAEEGYSIEAQTDRLTAYCKAKDWQVFKVYTDPGFSGSNIQRPALQNLFDDIKSGLIDCVLVYKLDRLSRSQKDTLYMIEDVFLANNIAFVSMQENFDTSTPFGRAMIGILSVFAQLEREQIKERMMMGRTERAKTGRWHGCGNRPFGYDYTNGKLDVNEFEAMIIRDVYELFFNHRPLNNIVTVINQKYGRLLNHTLIHSILSNPLYTGKITWSGKTYAGEHTPLVDDEAFRKSQILLQDRARIAAAKPKPFVAKHLLTGLLFCENCGARYFAKAINKKHSYYYCYSRAKPANSKVIDKNCRNPTYRVKILDELVLSEVSRLATDSTNLQAAASVSRTDKRQDVEKERRTLMQQIDALDLQMSRVTDLYQLGALTIEQVSDRIKTIKEKKSALQSTLDSLKISRDMPLTVKEATTLLDTFNAVMSGNDINNKRRYLQQLIKKIIVHPTVGDITIIWNFQK